MMIRWHLQHRKQEIFGALFALMAVAFVVVRATGDDHTDATTAKNNCMTRKNEVSTQRTDCQHAEQTLWADIEYAEDYYDSRYAVMSQSDRDAVEYALSGANGQRNSGISDYGFGYSYETNVNTGPPVGGDYYRQEGDNYYGMTFWINAENSYGLAINKYNTASGYYNTASQHYLSGQGFVDDAWDVLQNYP